MLTSVVLDFAEFNLSIEFPDVIKKEVAVPLVAATTLTASSSPASSSQALVAPTKAKVSLATRAKVSAGASVALATRPVVPKITPAQIVVEAAPKTKVSLATRVSLAPPTSRPRSALAPAVAPAQSRVRTASQARSGTLQTAVAAPQKPKVLLANRVSLAPRARGADRVLPKNRIIFG
jgi:hypothetical protein